MARHLAYLDQKIVQTIAKPDGRLLVCFPPRHGKSQLCSEYLPAWFLGMFPQLNVILASYEADFASSWGRKARNLLEEHCALFNMGIEGSSRAAGRWHTTQGGGMFTAGVGGPITGKGAELFILDDPVKNSEQAASEVYREKTWEWWQSTAYTRLHSGASVIGIQTRWHEDDWAGRVIRDMENGGEKWDIVNLPAFAEEGDVLGRQPGEPLWPQMYDTAALELRKKSVGSYVWSALYQQRPTPKEGGLFHREWFKQIHDDRMPEFRKLVRYWDTAGTDGDGDYSVGVLLGYDRRGGIERYIILDVVRGQWSPGKRDAQILATAQIDRKLYGKRSKTVIEHTANPDSKQVAMLIKQSLMNSHCRAGMNQVTISKEERAFPLSAACERGEIEIKVGPWVNDFLHEMCAFPNGTYDDQVDAASGAYNMLRTRTRLMAGAPA